MTDDQKSNIRVSTLLNGEGNRRTISLNYISTDIADECQEKGRKKITKKEGMSNGEKQINQKV